MPGTTIQPFIQVPRAPLPIAMVLASLIAGDLSVGHTVPESELSDVSVCENTQHDVWNDPVALKAKGCGDCADLVRAIGAWRGTHVGCAPIPGDVDRFHVVLGTAIDGSDEIMVDDVCVSHGSAPFGREVYESMIWWPIVRPTAATLGSSTSDPAVALPISFEVEIWPPLEEVIGAALLELSEEETAPVFLTAQVLTQLRAAILDLIANGASPSSAISVVLARGVEASNEALEAQLPEEQRTAIDRALVSLETMANGSDAEIRSCTSKGDAVCQSIALLGAIVAKDIGKARAPTAMARSVIEGARTAIHRAVASVKNAIRQSKVQAAAEAARAMPRRKPGCGGSCSAR